MLVLLTHTHTHTHTTQDISVEGLWVTTEYSQFWHRVKLGRTVSGYVFCLLGSDTVSESTRRATNTTDVFLDQKVDQHRQ